MKASTATPEGVPGAYELTESVGGSPYFNYVCPCGCGRPGCLPVALVKEERSWKWNGNEKRPTLEPSIRRLDGCRWHGWINDGVWSSAGDGPPLAANCSHGRTYEEIQMSKEEDVAAAKAAFEAAQAALEAAESEPAGNVAVSNESGAAVPTTGFVAPVAEAVDTRWLDAKVLDRGRPYGLVQPYEGAGKPRYQQDGVFFDHWGNEILEG